MGVLSVSVILLSLTCLAVFMGLVLAAIFFWPQKTRPDQASKRDAERNKPDLEPSSKE